MLTFLKEAGLVILRIIGIVDGFAPAVQATVPNAGNAVTSVVSELEQIKSLIIAIEAVGASMTPNMTGAQKLAAATPQIAQVILTSDMMIGHHIQDDALFKIGAEQIASGMANVLNALQPLGTIKQGAPVPPTPPTTGA